MTHLPPNRFAPLLLAAAVAGTPFLAGCGKEPVASPEVSLSAGPAKGPGKHTSATPPGTPPVAIPGPGSVDAGPPLTVASDQLARDFQADDRKAEEKYKGHWLIVDGVCKEAYERDIAGTVNRLFYFKDYTDPATRYTWQFKCQVDGPRWPAFDGLTQGQKVKIKARCTGAASQIVSLAEGEMIEAGPDPAKEFPAARLAGEFAAGRDKFRNDYNDKWLLVEGTVQETTAKDTPTVILEGTDGKAAGAVRVVARFDTYRAAEPARVKKGDRIKLKGKAALFLDDSNAVLVECKLVK
jgi:hypothetical protein